MAILQCSSFQDLYCCVAKSSFFSVMGMPLLYRRLNIQNPSGLYDFWLWNCSWHTDDGKEAVIFYPSSAPPPQTSNSTLCRVFPKTFYEMKATIHTHTCIHMTGIKKYIWKIPSLFHMEEIKSSVKLIIRFLCKYPFRRGFSCKSFMLICLKL